MDQPRTILVGTDFSDISDEALRAAALYAKTFKSRVLVAHVFDPTPVSYTHLAADERG